MNSNLLVRHCINFPAQYISFLNFIHPHFEIVSDIDLYDNPMPNGIIYTGQWTDDIKDKLNKITPNWIIVNAHHFDLDLSTNEGLVKNILPIHYVQIKNKAVKDSSTPVYNIMEYWSLLDKVKLCLIDNSSLQCDKFSEHSAYALYTAILGTPDVLNSVYFNMVDSRNVQRIASSILSFLIKVQSQQVNVSSVYYARLIAQSYRRYGKYIKQGISNFVKSKSVLEVSLYQLLAFLNKAR